MAGVDHKRFRAGLFTLAAAILVTHVFSIACQRQQPPVTQSANTEGKEMRTVIVPVEGMSCGACAARVKKSLKAINGVRDVHVNLEQRNASIEFEREKVAPEQLTAAINALGYKTGAPQPRTDQ